MKSSVTGQRSEEEIQRAKRLKERLVSIDDLMGLCESKSFIYKHLLDEKAQTKTELMAMVARADAANDEEFLAALGVKELEVS